MNLEDIAGCKSHVKGLLTHHVCRLTRLQNATKKVTSVEKVIMCLMLLLVSMQERNTAAMKIQVFVRNFLQRRRAKRQNQAAVVIQTSWRGYAARKKLRLRKQAQLRAMQHEAATIIQVCMCVIYLRVRSGV